MADEEKKAKAKKAPAKKAAAKKAPAKKAAAKKEAGAGSAKAAKKSAAKADAPDKAAAKAKKPAAKAKKPTAKEAAKAGSEPKPAAKAKKAPPAPVAPPVVRASARYVRVAPRKARLVADQVRGLHVEQARALLQFSPRGAARDIHKLIDSAAANAENNHDLIGDEMQVSRITVDEGPTLKRYRPRAQGRATPIHKRTSHISVALTPVED
jgi:ribosomal protein L22